MNRIPFVLGLRGFFAVQARAQFSAPGVAAPVAPVAEPRMARPRSYFAVEGKFGAHKRQNDHAFRDGHGEIRGEIDPALWQNREVGPGRQGATTRRSAPGHGRPPGPDQVGRDAEFGAVG